MNETDGILRHPQTKGRETDRPSLYHRATSQLSPWLEQPPLYVEGLFKNPLRVIRDTFSGIAMACHLPVAWDGISADRQIRPESASSTQSYVEQVGRQSDARGRGDPASEHGLDLAGRFASCRDGTFQCKLTMQTATNSRLGSQSRPAAPIGGDEHQFQQTRGNRLRAFVVWRWIAVPTYPPAAAVRGRYLREMLRESKSESTSSDGP